MPSAVSRSTGYICRLCRSQQALPAQQRYPLAFLETSKHQRRQNYLPTRSYASRVPPKPNARPATRTQASSISPGKGLASPTPQASATNPTTSTVPIDASDASGTLQQIRQEVNAIAASGEIPEKTKVLEILDQSYQFANLLVFGQTVAPEEEEVESEQKPTTTTKDGSLLSDLEEPTLPSRPSSEGTQINGAVRLPATYREKAGAYLCDTVYNLVKDPKVEIDKDVLSIYVRIICQIGHPQYLPEIFFLYANKAIPKPNTNPIVYGPPKPGAIDSAIPQELSDVALDAAIIQRNLPLAIAIIDTTVATRAFRRNKFFRKASIPLAAVGSTPLVAWAGAEWVAQWQNTFDPAMSKSMTMMGAMAYIGTLGTVGFIALTTWNDHHERVVWTPGTPLRYRWSREEERMYFDRIAVAWGFQRKHRRGEEMGEEWEALRETLGERSMILDKSDLLEGMQ